MHNTHHLIHKLVYMLLYIIVLLLNMNPKSTKSTKKKTTIKQTPEEPKTKKITLQQKVAKHPHFELIENGKIKCLLTGHEM